MIELKMTSMTMVQHIQKIKSSLQKHQGNPESVRWIRPTEMNKRQQQKNFLIVTRLTHLPD
ncbi:hypothetical protein [Halobacillus sp. BBL2006]|uniref:hypothetical protein n=1 Tax=Halobacillus sp. BBL2006 TaxID=1543706 RepID=UPI000541F7B4|nr:hypothetical protein [Halobacillus sp. BBL2006]KHE66986.1 hypothetical protein LD39_19890 [Halobacillus sp. BBL2006]